jgi:hypothetical protein
MDVLSSVPYYCSSAASSREVEEKKDGLEERFIPAVVRVDSIMGMARPGYVAHNAKRGWGAESSEINDTLEFARKEGVKMIISLSNMEYHASHDPEIERRWKALDDSHKFHHILNMDSFDEGFYPSQGPTLKKIEDFLRKVKSVKDGKVAVYCGAGQGRTFCYLTSWIIARERTDPEGGFSALMEISGGRLQATIHDEIEGNGGFKALGDYYKKIRS